VYIKYGEYINKKITEQEISVILR